MRLPIRPVDLAALRGDVLTAGCLGFLGDIISQLCIEARGASTDWNRCFAVTTFNSMYIGGFLHFLYQTYPLVVAAVASRSLAGGSLLARRLSNENSLAHSFSCAVVDNIHCGLIYIPAYFLGVGALQSDRFTESLANLKQEWVTTYATCTGFWVPYMWANFALVPPARRVQAMAVGNLGWSVVIDYLSHRSRSTGATRDNDATGRA